MFARRVPSLLSKGHGHADLPRRLGLQRGRSQYQKTFSLCPPRDNPHLHHGLNVLKPPLDTPCEVCGPAWTWKSEREGKFFCKDVLEEPLIQYRRGGYHPVHIEDSLAGGRYVVLNKLSWGRHGTIWLGKDTRSSQLVAIKVCRSEVRREGEEEAMLLEQMATGPADHPGRAYIRNLLDRFEITGPNGCHLCLVFEALGPVLKPHELTAHAAWKVARQMVEGIAYAHESGVVHGDVRRDRFFFTNSRLLHQKHNATNPLEKVKMGSVQPVDDSGHVLPIYAADNDVGVPRYLVGGPWPVDDRDRLPETSKGVLDDFQVRLTGFGGNRWNAGLQEFSEEFCSDSRAPELVLDSQLSPSADIWSLACLLYDILMGEAPVWTDGTKDDLIQEWIVVFGDLPEEWKCHSPPTSDEWRKPGQDNMRDQIMTSDFSLLPGELWFSKQDLENLADLLTSMTQYRPSCRPTAAQVLEHPWFRQKPVLEPVDGPSRAEAEAAWASDKREFVRRWNLQDSSVCWGSFEGFWLRMKQKNAASRG